MPSSSDKPEKKSKSSSTKKSSSSKSSSSKSSSAKSSSKKPSSKSSSSKPSSKTGSAAPAAGAVPFSTKNLKSVAKTLTKVKTKEVGLGVDNQMVQSYAKIFNENKGDLKKISKKCGFVFKKGFTCSDGTTFGKAVVSGMCLAD